MDVRLRTAIVLAAGIWATATPARAQTGSGVSGLVTDATGAVLPGVTVEASSPALIERVRSTVTDAQGRYTLIELRPGLYSVTFTLPGFATVRRQGLELRADFMASANIALTVSALEETITVSGAASVVDVSAAARTHVLTRELLDALPTNRSVQRLGETILGVSPSTRDVGGTSLLDNTNMTVRGTAGKETSMLLDGMSVNSSHSDGSTQAFQNHATTEEVSLTTGGAGADTSAGGIRLNVVPKTGGNDFSGETYFGGSNGAWQSNNLTPELQRLNVRVPDAVQHIFEQNHSLGGPVRRDQLWFFGSFRRASVNRFVTGSSYADGSPGIKDQRVTNATLRLTWQAAAKHKFTVYTDRIFKWVGHDFAAGVDPATAAGYHDPGRALFYIGQAKWTAPLTSRVLAEAGMSANVQRWTIYYQPGIAKERGTPEWYAGASRRDVILGTTWGARSAGQSRMETDHFTTSSSLSYVTGSHNLKTGFQLTWGQNGVERDMNADLVQRYRNGVPDTVQIFNTPMNSDQYVRADVGIYAQDSWTLGRLTANTGIRFEHFDAEIPPQYAPAGRFMPARAFDRVPHLPLWNDIAPRLGIVYDVFGDASTAIKASANKYMTPLTGSFSRRYNQMYVGDGDADVRTWRDLNGDDIAQDSELGPTSNLRFGLEAFRRPDPDVRREYQWEYSLGVQRELVKGVAVTGAWYRRIARNLDKTINTLVDDTDYSPFTAANPLDGSPLTIYNLNPAKLGQVDLVDSDSDTDRRIYTGIELGFNARIRGGGSAYGGWIAERNVSVRCEVEDPNAQRFCDETRLDIPFRHQFKFAGAYTLPLGVQASASLQSYPGGELGVSWNVPPNLFPGGRTQPVTVPLVAPGTKFLRRLNQLDVGIRRSIRAGRGRVTALFDVYNALNSSVVLSENLTFGPNLGLPLSMLQGRLVRLSAQLAF